MHSPDRLPAAVTMPDSWRLGHARMDRRHEEFFGLLRALQRATDAQLPLALDALADHTRTHFDDENASMLESDFPARDCHIAEHAAVLASIDGVRRRVAAGDVAPAHVLARELAAGFPAHCDYLDAALAHWLCRRRLGGKPVVVRRHAASAPAHTAALETSRC